jgi:hypothetical protein
MMRRIATCIGFSLLASWAGPAFAQEGDETHSFPAVCKADYEQRLGFEQRLFRSTVFGSPEIQWFEPGNVLYDKEGNTWMKISDDAWQSPDIPDETWTDSIMNDEREIEPRFGILETRRALSSEVLPNMLQAVRAYQCRLRATCMTVAESREEDPEEENATLDIQPPGCIEFEMPVFQGCIDVDSVLIESLACDDAADLLIEREIRMLEMIIGYDAAYRSLLQFAGIFEGFLTDFQSPLLQPLWQMVRAAGSLDGIPCFLAECNE